MQDENVPDNADEAEREAERQHRLGVKICEALIDQSLRKDRELMEAPLSTPVIQ